MRICKIPANKINVLNPYYNAPALTAPNSNSTVGTVIREGLGLDVFRPDLHTFYLIPGFNWDILFPLKEDPTTAEDPIAFYSR